MQPGDGVACRPSRDAPMVKAGVEAAVKRDLLRIGKRDRNLATGGLAHLALALGRDLDASGQSLTSRSLAARSLAPGLEQLRDQTPPAAVRDRVDELARRRATRVRRTVQAKDSL